MDEVRIVRNKLSAQRLLNQTFNFFGHKLAGGTALFGLKYLQFNPETSILFY